MRGQALGEGSGWMRNRIKFILTNCHIPSDFQGGSASMPRTGNRPSPRKFSVVCAAEKSPISTSGKSTLVPRGPHTGHRPLTLLSCVLCEVFGPWLHSSFISQSALGEAWSGRPMASPWERFSALLRFKVYICSRVFLF